MNENGFEDLKSEKDFKSKDVAFNLGINESTYFEWKHNKILTKRLIGIADFYKINIDYMLKLDNEWKIIFDKTVLDLKAIGDHLKEARQNMKISLRVKNKYF